ncbi:nucleoside triphosphate pyrophosphohydrolase [Vallitalea okinawensis]|uniref:nucleoside triphosphate pyrophosphohydrolase n=1 Tax=Vallitalea okinawensis TaxID=2078660 RepID=UPI001FA86002|nr:nucleoside triphosphate pyrophosphohydrolase [Vallitalea okinawensis]
MKELIDKKMYTFDDLLLIMRILRKECPWDKEQSHKSLLEPLLEETYELKNAILKEDILNMQEELGDVLLQVIFHAQIASEYDNFGMNDITTHLAKKLIFRHPHIFSTETAKNTEEVKQNWEALKQIEKGHETYTEALEDVPETLPALIRAMKIQKKASKIGFDWNEIDGVFDKLHEEIDELTLAFKEGENNEIEEEFGDLLFTMVNLSRFFKINPEFALTNAIEKFINRFRYIEFFANKSGRKMEKMTLDEMNTLWEKAKSCT